MRFKSYSPFQNLFQNLCPAPEPNEPLTGHPPQTAQWSPREQAVITEAIQPHKTGRVRYKASWWAARCLEEIPIATGEVVDIVGIQGITLLVEPTILLKAAPAELDKVRQAWQQRGETLKTAQPQKPATTLLGLLQTPIGKPAVSEPNSPESIANETWQRFLQGKPVYIKAFQKCCDFLGLDWQEILGEDPAAEPPASPSSVSSPPASLLPFSALPPSLPEPSFNFVGRDQAIADLEGLVQAGAKIITVLGTGGLGKTTLVRQFFNQRYELVLECWMAKETRNLTPAENVVQEWLQRYLGEQPSRKFSVSLERLRLRLRQGTVNGAPVRIGVLIDNLEPALDRNGCLIEAHRNYAALLEVLADPTVQCVTLVTSREPLHEVNITVEPYLLPSLSVAAWQEFFTHHQVCPTMPALEEMHAAYNGNAKAMTILSSVIKLDCEGDLAAYWQEHQTDLLGETSLEGLVESHFSRLRQLYPEAYRLLYRLGCYRYQDVLNVPAEGLACLLWDVPESEHRRVIRFLRELFLIESHGTGYHLHPTIQVKALEWLHVHQEWVQSHRVAARFWSDSVPTIATITDALKALEAYHHLVQIQDWEGAAAVILQRRSGQGVEAEELGVAFYRLGLLQPMISAITHIIDHLHPGASLGNLHRILGDLYWLRGSLHRAIASHEQARTLAVAYQLKDLELVSLFNIGLCKIDLWELEEAFQIFSAVNQRAIHTEHHVYAVGTWFCLALLHAYRGEREQAQALIQQVSQEFSTISFSAWSRCYSLIFVGLAEKQLGHLDNAQRMYDMAQFFAERSQYPQVKARALSGLAELYRQRQENQTALSHLLAAKQLLDRLEARGDLAEVHYQLGLTYHRLKDLGASQENFQSALRLFADMSAPKQIERVQQAMQALG